jgi:hypothetical protein
VKPLFYVYRVLLAGIHLMRTGVVNANTVEKLQERHREQEIPQFLRSRKKPLLAPELLTLALLRTPATVAMRFVAIIH